ncbi:lysophospholipid acyltransferase family protein [Roseococcus sp. YIM B11640]|uniref:lysophospholipid acyltransferase family protein n=1 Tax=Roseococcus sp. YIM B11640 TaxID=3133973 RepID=UPI003C7C3F80
MSALIRRFLVLVVRLMVGARADWRGCAPDPRQRIYFANHNSHFDTVAIIAALPYELRRLTHPVAARDYWNRNAVLRWIAERGLRAVLIDRKPVRGEDPLGPAATVLEQGHSIIIFPEGTRGTGEEVGPFRAGLHRLATRFPEAEMIPVYLDNLQRILPKGSMLPVPVTCTARFGAPVRPEPGEERSAFLERARQAVLDLA